MKRLGFVVVVVSSEEGRERGFRRRFLTPVQRNSRVAGVRTVVKGMYPQILLSVLILVASGPAPNGTAQAQTAEEVEQLKSKTSYHDTEIEASKGTINKHQADIDDLRHSNNDRASRIAALETAIAALQK